MERIIATFKIQGLNGSRDIEVPTDVPVQDLAEMVLSSYFGSAAPRGGMIKMKAEPPGRMLYPNETLAEAGVWDGAIITILY